MAEKEGAVPNPVAGLQFCRSESVSLLITSAPCCSNQNYLIYDETNGALLLQTEPAATCCSGSSEILCDAEERPILTLRKNGKWKAYSGNGIDPAARLFTIKSSGLFRPSLHIFVAPKTHKTHKDEPDFRAKESGSKVLVFRGRTDHMVAEMKTKGWFSSDRCVWVENGIDYAFICAVMVAILKDASSRRSAAAAASAGAGAGAGGPTPAI